MPVSGPDGVFGLLGLRLTDTSRSVPWSWQGGCDVPKLEHEMGSWQLRDHVNNHVMLNWRPVPGIFTTIRFGSPKMLHHDPYHAYQKEKYLINPLVY